MPNGQSPDTSFKALLQNKQLNPKAMECDILIGLQHSSLVSVGNLADVGYYTFFVLGDQVMQVVDGNKIKIQVSGKAVLQAWRDHQGLQRMQPEDGKEVALS